ncbi:MAG: hypothetical protein R2713_11495 [Ilumatobacteraceae bacterium]
MENDLPAWRPAARGIDEAELDRVIGSMYAYVEQAFPSLIRLGYASHFATDDE